MNGNNHPGDTRAMGSGGQPGPVAPRYGAPPQAAGPYGAPHPGPQPGYPPQAPLQAGGYPPAGPHAVPGPHAMPGPHGGYGAPAPAPAPGRRDELMAGAGRTVFEFTGSEAEKDHRGSRGTFMGATLDLASLREERESNLRSGPSGWIFAGIAVLLAGGITAYMLMKPDAKPEEHAAVVAAADAPAPAPEAKAAGDETGGGGSAGDETAGGSGDPAAADGKAPAADAKALADDAKAVAPPVTPAPEPTPATPPADPPKEDPKPKSTGGGTKHTGGKSTGGTKPKPKEDPKPSGGGKSLKPKKPPRDPLGNLPPPPG